jgi:hypothetical protein
VRAIEALGATQRVTEQRVPARVDAAIRATTSTPLPVPCHASLVDRYDAYQHTRELYSENLWLRELVTAAAQELERLASRGQACSLSERRRAE